MPALSSVYVAVEGRGSTVLVADVTARTFLYSVLLTLMPDLVVFFQQMRHESSLKVAC